MSKLEYKGEWYSQTSLFSMPECEVSPRQFARNIADGQTVARAMRKVCGSTLSNIASKKARKKRGKGRIKGDKNKPKPTVIKSELPVYSKEEALRIMAPAVNPKKCHLHSYKVFK